MECLPKKKKVAGSQKKKVVGSQVALWDHTLQLYAFRIEKAMMNHREKNRRTKDIILTLTHNNPVPY